MTKEELKMFGLPEDLEETKIIEEFNKMYIKKTDVLKDETLTDQVVGKRIGSIQTTLLRAFNKDHSFAIGEDKKPIKMEELINSISEELKNKDIENEKKQKLSVDQRVTEAENKLESILKEKESYKKKLGEVTLEFENTKTESQKNIDSILLKYKLNESKSKVPFIDDLTDIQRTGFDSILERNYNLEFDEKKEAIVIKTKGGELIPSKVSSGFASLDEVLLNIAESGNILKKNNAKPTQRNNIQQAGDEKAKPQVIRKKSLLDINSL